MAGIKDVAARARVSVATVSRVLNGHPAVRPGTRERVRAAIDELGYRPNGVARSLRTDHTSTLGLVVSDVLNPFFTALARAVEDEARAHGYSVVFGNADEQSALQDHHVRTLLERRIDGLLVSPTADSASLVTEVAGSGVPMVFVDRWIAGCPQVPVVRTDGRAAIAALVDHLHRLGHRRLAVITGPATTTTGNERAEAFLGALAAHGLPAPAHYREEGDFQAGSGRRATARFLDLPEPPEAIFATDNLMALGAMDEIRARGLRVPDDVALAAFDDIPWFLHTDPPVTAIAQPTEALGHGAVRALIDLIEGRPAASLTLTADLVPRRSCGE
ncbi:LacI family DNA-binding transcriptional regulator [Streptomyces sp. TRM70308]|uniref:LacI family DNA-binding transcriptional regulator n=1 Tax=Streptomyces sp. TRM70308 TaxID=3131932 RepID=UPI003CFEA391